MLPVPVKVTALEAVEVVLRVAPGPLGATEGLGGWQIDGEAGPRRALGEAAVKAPAGV